MDPMNYLTLLSGLNLIWFPAFGFALERAAGKGYLSDAFVICAEMIYLFAMLAYPIVLI